MWRAVGTRGRDGARGFSAGAVRLVARAVVVAMLLAVPVFPSSVAMAVDDAYEPDDTVGTANPITPDGTRQTHTFDHEADVDYVYFDAVAGTEYVIRTAALDNIMPNASLTAYHEAGGIIQTVERNVVGIISRIVYTPSTNERVYVKAYQAEGSTGQYDLIVGRRQTLSGTVTDESTGDPLSPVTVRVWEKTGGGGSYTATSTASAADGSWSTLIDPGTYRVEFNPVMLDLGYVVEYYDGVRSLTDATPVVITNAGADWLDATLIKGGSITGTVTALASGAPLAGIRVRPYVWNGSSWEWSGSETATQADGGYVVPMLWPGTYRVGFSDAGGVYASEYYEDSATIEDADSVTVTNGGVTTGVSVALSRKGVITGTVTQAVGGGVLNGIEVAVRNVSLGGGWGGAQVVTTNASGVFTAYVDAGTYEVRYSDPSGTYATEYWNDTYIDVEATSVAVARDETVTRDASLALAGTIQGIVTSEQGVPGTFQVTAWMEGAAGWRPLAYDYADPATGEYTLTVPPGTLRVTFYDQDGKHLTEVYDDILLESNGIEAGDDIPVSAGGVVTLEEAVLSAYATISGVVTAADGGAVLEDVRVDVRRWTGTWWEPAYFTRSAWNGTYSVNVSPGTYAVLFAWETSEPHSPYVWEWYDGVWSGYGQPTPIALVAGDVRDDIDVALDELGYITGTVTDAVSGDPVGGIQVNAYIEDPPGIWGSRYASAMTSTEGTYTIGLPEGEWRLGFWDQMGTYAQEFTGDAWFVEEATSIMVSPGETVSTGADAALERYAQIRGSVTAAEDGAPLGEVLVRFHILDDAGNARLYQVSDRQTAADTGTYATHVPPGDYLVEFDASGSRPWLAKQYYYMAYAPSGATTVTVAAGGLQTNVSAQLYELTDAPVTMLATATGSADMLEITLTARGLVADVAATYYGVDDVDQGEYTGPFEVTEDGYHEITYASVDVLGNREATQTAVLHDRVPPAAANVWSTSHPDPDTWYGNRVGVWAWDAVSDGSGIAQYWVSADQTADTATGPSDDAVLDPRTKMYQPLTDGVWYFHVRAEDNGSNLGAMAHSMVRVDAAAPAGTMTLAGGATSTSELEVTVNSAVTDAHSGMGDMRISADGGTTWGEWMPYAAERLVTLPDGDGEKTVAVEYRDTAVPPNVRQLTDTITVSTLPGEELLDRWWGTDRYLTACTIATESFDTAETVVLATGAAFPDALSASGLAGAYDGPLLLTAPTALPDTVRQTIIDLGASKVFIVGGTSAVTLAVEQAVDGIAGVSVERIAGADRYATAAAVADAIEEHAGAAFAGRAFIARGDNFADALAVAPFAYSQGIPVLLTGSTTLSAATGSAVTRLGVSECVIAGGTAAVSSGVEAALDALPGVSVVRWSGADRYATAVDVATKGIARGWGSWRLVGLATGTSFPDALGGGVACGAYNGVLLMTRPDTLSAATAAALTAHAPEIERCRVFGGDSAVSPAVYAQIEAILE
ncbi:MAG: cell wall-binding repeat-containing protein [Coriobacteriia bacterium]|nr:cell wall-binding repeat-containing protein [Coriobacteriia bacterium]